MSDNCKDCFNGCVDRVPDNCVKYTGIDIPSLGIVNGSSYAVVQSQIFSYITSIINGTGIKFNLTDLYICEIIQNELGDYNSITLLNLLNVLSQIICNINQKIENTIESIVVLNADYNIKCLSDVTNSSDTHMIVQATINKLCVLQNTFDSFVTNVEANYLNSSNINTYIQNYNTNIVKTDLVSYKMIPYVAYPYFPTTAALNSANFNSTGAGQGLWAKVYLCNGDNNTPDMRGVTTVGATNMTGVIPMSAQVNPSVGNFPNPNYNIKSIFGENSVTLQKSEMPIHDHQTSVTAVSTVEELPHSHQEGSGGSGQGGGGEDGTEYAGKYTSSVKTNLTVNTFVTVDVLNEGGGQAHTNIQPSIGCYYIMYIP